MPSPSIKNLFGYLPEDTLTLSLTTLTHPGDLPAVLAVLNDLIQNPDQVFTYEYRNKHKNGSWVWIEGIFSNLLTEPGVEAIVINLHDINSRKCAEDALKKNEEKYRLLTENMKDVIWTLDTETSRFTYMSPSVEKLRGYTTEEVLSQTMADSLTSEGAPAIHTLLKEQLSDFSNNQFGPDKYFYTEIEQPKKDGSTVWTEVVTNYFTNPETGHVEIKGVTREISERRQAELERQVLFEIMQGLGSSEDLQQFLRLIHHSISKVIDATNISIVYYNKDSGLFEELYCVDEYDPPMPPSKLEKSITSYVFKTGEPILLHDTEFEELARQGILELIGTNSASWLGAPLKNGNEVIGVISVQNYLDKNCYTEREKEFLASVSSQAALAVERKRAEQALQESEERWHFALEGAGDGVWDWNAQTNKAFFSHQWKAMLGFDNNEIGDSFDEWKVRVHPDDLNYVPSELERHITGKSLFYMTEHRLLCKNGTYKWILDRGKVVSWGENHKPLRIIGTHTDISVRKSTEEEISRKSEDLVLLKKLNDSVNRGDSLQKCLEYLGEETKRIFSSYGATIYLLGANGDTLEMQNLALHSNVLEWIEKTIGMKIPRVKIKLTPESIYRQTLECKKFRLIEDPDVILKMMYEFTDSKIFQKLIPKIAKGLKIHSIISIPLISDGEAVGLLEFSSNAPFNDDDLIRLETISSEFSSIIRHKQAEDALKESEEKFRQIIERSKEVFCRQDFSTLLFEYISPKVVDLLGYAAEEVLQLDIESLRSIFHPNDLKKMNDFRKELVEADRIGKKKYELEFRLRNKQGEFKWILGNYSLIRNSDGEPQLIVSTLSDITERKMEENILNARLRLMQLAPRLNMKELLVATLDEVEALTGSEIGFYHFIETDQEHITLQAWSTKTLEKCIVVGHELHYAMADAGVWIDCVRKRKATIHNQFMALKHRKGMPEGHPAINREMVVPVFRDDKIVSVLGVGNKPSDYTPDDLELVTKLADIAWDIVETKRIEEALKESESIFSAFMENSPIYVFFKDREIRTKRLSRNYEQLLGKPLDQLLNKTMDDLFPSDLAKNMIKDDQKILEEGKPTVIEEELNGRFYTTIKFPIEKEGKPEYLAGYTIDITDRIQAQNKLKESEQLFRTVVTNTPIVSFVLDNSGIFLLSEGMGLEKLGLKPGEVVGQSALEIYREYPEIVNGIMTSLSGKPAHEPVEVAGIYFDIRYTPVFDADGKVVRVIGVANDMTEYFLAEKELAKSEELYRLISTVVSDYLFSAQIDQNNVLNLNWVAGAFEKITGYSFLDYKQRGGWRAAIHPDDLPIDDRDLNTLRENKKVITEIRTIKNDESVAWVRVYSQPIWDEENNQLVGIKGAVQDITDRKLAEEEVRKSADEFSALYETAGDFSMQRDPYVILRTINERASSLFGAANAFVCLYDPDQGDLELRISKTPTLPVGTRIKLGEGLSGKVAEMKKPIIVDDYNIWPGRMPDVGETIFAASLGVPMLYGGQLIGVLGVQEIHPNKHKFTEADAHFLSLFASQAAGAVYSADLFEKIRQNAIELEKRVDERTKELQLKNKELETFTYTVSHDLKAPLRGISGYSTLLMEDHANQLDEEGRAYLNNLVGATGRMDILIENLLTYSRAERLEIKKTKINIEELIDNLLKEHVAELSKKKIRVIKELKCIELVTDREALTQAMRNLLDNAIKFTGEQQKSVISINSDTISEHCLISVRDNGIGFDMKFHDKIFEIFQRLHLPEEYPGTGVGLALVRKAIERIGGKVWAESEIGKGSTFFVEIPL